MRITEIQIGYPEPTFPGGLSVTEMQDILKGINWENGEEVSTEAVRCNNRCSGNDTTVEVPLLKASL